MHLSIYFSAMHKMLSEGHAAIQRIAWHRCRLCAQSMNLSWGLQNLYTVRVSLYLDGFGLSDEATERFGVRDICSVEDPELSGHVFYVNAEKVWKLM